MAGVFVDRPRAGRKDISARDGLEKITGSSTRYQEAEKAAAAAKASQQGR